MIYDLRFTIFVKQSAADILSAETAMLPTASRQHRERLPASQSSINHKS